MPSTADSKGGWYRATTDDKQWFVWRNEHSGCLWGVRPVGFVVLDVDAKNNGIERFAELEAIHGKLPDTVECKSGGGGRHLYFACDPSDSFGGKKIISGCDAVELISGTKGVVVPPSIHPTTHNAYEWLPGKAPWECPMATLPQWLRTLANTPHVSSSCPKSSTSSASVGFTIADGFATLGDLPSGERNIPVANAVIQEKLKGTSEADCIAKGIEWAARQNPPFDVDNLRSKVKSIYANDNFKPKASSCFSQNAQCPLPNDFADDNPSGEEEKNCNDQRPNALTLHADAYCGLFGEMLHAIEPEIESTPASVLLGWLTNFGNVIGRSAHFNVIGRPHYGCLFVANVGGTGDGKGDSWGIAKRPFAIVESQWAAERIKGVGSGEGLIEQIADDNGDKAGADDKRLLIRLPELSRALTLGRRDGSTLSEILREAWDSERLSIPNRNANALASTAYIVSVNGDITPGVIRKLLAKGNEAFDGWANRFLWCIIESVRDLPDGGNVHVIDPFLDRLRDAIKFARSIGEVKRDAKANELWRSVYGELRRSGNRTPHTDRARPYVMRLALLYALGDCSPVIREDHLRAALAVWRYCEASAKEIFGEQKSTDDSTPMPTPLDVRLANAINAKPGITRTELRVDHHVKASEYESALASLESRHLAHRLTVDRAERWYPGKRDGDAVGVGGDDDGDGGNGTVHPSLLTDLPLTMGTDVQSQSVGALGHSGHWASTDETRMPNAPMPSVPNGATTKSECPNAPMPNAPTLNAENQQKEERKDCHVIAQSSSDELPPTIWPSPPKDAREADWRVRYEAARQADYAKQKRMEAECEPMNAEECLRQLESL